MNRKLLDPRKERSTKKGTIAEHKAVIWLLEQKFEVFSNVCGAGPIDLIAWKPDEGPYLIDVKTSLRREKGEEYYYHIDRKACALALISGIRFLCYQPDEDRFFWADEYLKLGCTCDPKA